MDRRRRTTTAPPLVRVVVAVDPAGRTPTAHETGIVVAGDPCAGPVDVLADASLRASPDTWARRAIDAYTTYQADMIVAEGNQGNELVRLTLHTIDPYVPVEIVHATRGKRTRAEPVAALYEQGRVHHVGAFAALEDQLCLWDATSGDLSPDRLDALVWAVTQLAVDGQPELGLVSSRGYGTRTRRGPRRTRRRAHSISCSSTSDAREREPCHRPPRPEARPRHSDGRRRRVFPPTPTLPCTTGDFPHVRCVRWVRPIATEPTSIPPSAAVRKSQLKYDFPCPGDQSHGVWRPHGRGEGATRCADARAHP